MNANVLVHYEGSFVDGGEVFDSSFARNEPAEFPLRGVVQGFSEAITHMRPGDEVIATFPGSLGYGPEGRGPIPPNAALRFRIVLLAFQEPGGQVIEAPQ
jgi:FKBP-type peptidyl-prolyl cis-trans isomerase